MAGLPVTMKTVAERAGVSLMTVSRVLRNHGNVGEATRRRVQAAIDATGYRVNPLVGAWMAHMRTSRAREAASQTIAFVTAESSQEGWRRSLTLRRYYEGACARAEELGFKVEHFWMGQKGMSGARMSQILRTRGISGLLLGPVPQPVVTVDLKWSWFATVVLGYSVRKPTLHRVTNHHIHSIRLALTEARRLGYRRIGLALEASKDARVDYNWTTGLLPYQSSVRAADRIPPYLPERLNRDGFLRWVEKRRPDLIFSGRQDMVEWLREVGWKVPEEVGFATLEYYPEYGDLAGVDQNSLTIGSAAVDLVVEQLYHNERGVPEKAKVVMIEGHWHPGASAARSPGAEEPNPSCSRPFLRNAQKDPAE